MHPNEVSRITPGVTLAVEQKDYLYGNGLALLIVQSVGVNQELLASMEWVRLDCLRLSDDGATIGPFSPIVRTKALAAAVRPTGWLPPREQPPGPGGHDSMPEDRRTQ
jgi:hypothetical protein